MSDDISLAKFHLTAKEVASENIKRFCVGDRVISVVDDAEVEGVLDSIDGSKAKLKTAWGSFKIDLWHTIPLDSMV